jgi:hypothetical protein
MPSMPSCPAGPAGPIGPSQLLRINAPAISSANPLNKVIIEIFFCIVKRFALEISTPGPTHIKIRK